MRALSLLAVATQALHVLAGQTGLPRPHNYDQGQFPLTGHSQNEHSVSKSRPNVLFILTDDQDLHMQSLDYLPLIKKHLLDKGTFYKRHFCTTALCCPSRVSLWTGRAAHNTNVTDVKPPYGIVSTQRIDTLTKAKSLPRRLPKICSARAQ
jgi:hypothetical protein